MKHIEKIEKLPLSKRIDENTVENYEGCLADIINKINELVDAVGDKHTSFIQNLIQRVEGERKRMDVGNIGVDSVSFPSGEIWTQEKRAMWNSALDTIIKMLKEEIL